MFDVPVDAAYVWLGVAAVSAVALAVVVGLPSATPPDATAAADAVDTVAAGPPGSQDTHSLDADRMRLGPSQIGLDGPGGTAHATFAYGPVTPVANDSRLQAILHGARPADEFDSTDAFEDAIRTAQEREPRWRGAPSRLVVRRVSWEGVDATLVG